jgi:hypothetical protein
VLGPELAVLWKCQSRQFEDVALVLNPAMLESSDFTSGKLYWVFDKHKPCSVREDEQAVANEEVGNLRSKTIWDD